MLGWLFGKKDRDGAGATETRELFSLGRTVNAPPERAFGMCGRLDTYVL